MATEKQLTLKAGCLAFLDSFAGLVPIKVIRITSTPDPLLAHPRQEVEFEVTETLGAYKKGDRDTTSPRYAVPRGAIHHKAYSTTIRPYNVEVTP